MLSSYALDQRIVICPHGLPRGTEPREHCATLVLHCGGDLQRVIEGVPGGLDRFVRHLERIRGLDAERPLVVLTRTNPLGLGVLQTRRALEEAVPSLANAYWLIFVDERDDPFFMEAAARLGPMVGDIATAPLWFAPHRQRFLVVLGGRKVAPTQLRGRLAQLHATESSTDLDADPESGTRRVAVPRESNSSAPPPDYDDLPDAGVR